MSLRILSYNVHRCIGVDGNYMPNRIVQIVTDLDPDLVALQEVQIFNKGANDLLAYFKNHTSYKIILGLTMDLEDSSYGNVMLAKVKECRQSRVNISVPDREPRSFIELEFEWNQKQICCICTHLGLSPSERRFQARTILKHISKKEQKDLIVLCGDINEWFLWGRPLKWFHKHFTQPPSLATFPTFFPFLSLDRIWVSPITSIKEIQVYKNSVTRIASDHYPIFVDLEI